VVPFRALRRSGTLLLRAVNGNVFDWIYGNYASYLNRAPLDRAGADLALRYQNGELLDSYEAWMERSPGASQTCHGDSGGPVVSYRDGQPEILGITSWSWQSATELCDYGSVIAIFGADAAALLAQVSD
jgi:hypothetical protein